MERNQRSISYIFKFIRREEIRFGNKSIDSKIDISVQSYLLEFEITRSFAKSQEDGVRASAVEALQDR